jgi:hypothetical protein
MSPRFHLCFGDFWIDRSDRVAGLAPAAASTFAIWGSCLLQLGALSFVITLPFVGGCAGSSAPQLPVQNANSVHSLLIAPVLQGEYFCDAAINNPNVQSEDDAALLCAALHKNGAGRIITTLDALGPVASPSGKYQLGYTLEIPVFRYFRKVGGQWTFDEASLSSNLTTIADVNRPVVIFLSSDHFVDSNVALASDLASNQTNLMWTRDGPLVSNQYFGNSIIAWTLDNQDAPVNTMRHEAFNAILDALCKLPTASQAKIAGVAVLGETSQLIPDLQSNPSFDVPMYESTDYSPVAVGEFRAWLSQRYGNIENLNMALDATFASFSAINPPSKDIHTEQLTTYFDHIDAAAAGRVAIYGWVYDKRGRDLSVSIYLDGKPAGVAETGLNRTDVTAADPSITNPNVGFRLMLDYRNIPYGVHTLDVLANIANELPLQLAHQNLLIEDRNQDAPPNIPYLTINAAPLSADAFVSGSLDGPAPQQSLFYNPLAQLWLEFRNEVVRSFVIRYSQMVENSCIPSEKIFLHQIVPSLYGSWNGELLAVDASLQLNRASNPGVTLYGGSAFGEAFLTMKRQLGWAQYSVGEMHPMVPLTPAEYLAMFELHRTNGAVFVAPYYMSTYTAPTAGLSGFLIDPDNSTYGSNLYYRAIQNVMSQ